MITVREAVIDDIEGIRSVFQAEYQDHYAYPQYYDGDALARLIYADGTILMVAVDSDTGRIAGTASVVFSVGAHNDLVGEFGRLVVHPEYRKQGIGKQLMEARVNCVKSRLHVGIVENRAAHNFSQKISGRFGFVPVGFIPMKLFLSRRESVAVFVQHFADALMMRRNHPRIIPEAAMLAGFALENCRLSPDAIIDDSTPAYPHDDTFRLDELQTEGYAPLLRIERGRVKHRDVFGPVRLHYGAFQLQARHSHYLIARREGQVAGGIGYMIDEADRAVRIFELISTTDAPIRFLIDSLLNKCQSELNVDYVDIDVSAYSPAMQRTLLELGFLPASYIPAQVFHEVERLDAMRMVRLLVPLDTGELQFCQAMEPIAAAVLESFAVFKVMPRIVEAARQTTLLRGLSDEQMHRLLGICVPKSFAADVAIYRQGEADGTMYLILDGLVQLERDRQRVACLSKGQCIGETALLHPPESAAEHSIDAIAQTDVDSASFSIESFRGLVRQRPDIGLVIFRNLAAELRAKLQNA